MIIRPFKAQQEAQETATEEMRMQWEEKLQKMAPVFTDDIEVVEIADGISCDVGSCLQRMKELAEEVASGTLEKEDCEIKQTECEQWGCEIDRLVLGEAMNRVNAHLSDGNLVLPLDEDNVQNISVPFQNMSSSALGVDATMINIVTPEKAAQAAAALDAALELLDSQRRTLDAVHNRLVQVLQ